MMLAPTTRRLTPRLLSGRRLCLPILAALAAPLQAQDFSVDAAAIEVPGTLLECDIAFTIGIPPVPLALPGTLPNPLGMGLPVGADVDAVSYGVDTPDLLGTNHFMVLFFSVSPTSVGAPGSAVAAETNGVAGDRFRTTANTVGGSGALTKSSDATAARLSIAPESNIDALSDQRGAPEFLGPAWKGAYFSLSAATVPLVLGMPGLAAVDPATLLYNGPALPIASPPVVYATSAALGLVPGDEIDAVMVNDVGILAQLDASDRIYVSLAPGSPTLAALGASPADLLIVAPLPAGGPAVAVTAAQLRLLATDDVDGATIWDPGTWTELGGGLPGGGTQPVLLGVGPATPGSINQLEMTGAPVGLPSFLVIGFSALNAPIKGGLLVPNPNYIISLPTLGTVVLPFVWPSAPAGIPIYGQHWVVDPSGPHGFTASNGIQVISQ